MYEDYYTNQNENGVPVYQGLRVRGVTGLAAVVKRSISQRHHPSGSRVRRETLRRSNMATTSSNVTAKVAARKI